MVLKTFKNQYILIINWDNELIKWRVLLKLKIKANLI